MQKRHVRFVALLAFSLTLSGLILSWLFQEQLARVFLPNDPDTLAPMLIATLSPHEVATLRSATVERYVKILGIPRTIDTLHQIDPVACHDAAHIIGDIAYRQAGTVAGSFDLCSEQCMSGCIHGALLAAVAGEVHYDSGEHGHVALEDFASDIPTICTTDGTDADIEGTCIHGVGHALMSLSRHINDGLTLCSEYTDAHKRYYCETGAFMEVLLGSSNRYSSSSNPLYPCDTYGTHPSACMRYQTDLIVRVHGETGIVNYCNSLTDSALHIGCFHGLGRHLTGSILSGDADITLCQESGHVTARASCVESAAEILHDYPDRDPALCQGLAAEPALLSICETALERGLYSLEKDFSPYVAESAIRP